MFKVLSFAKRTWRFLGTPVGCLRKIWAAARPKQAQTPPEVRHGGSHHGNCPDLWVCTVRVVQTYCSGNPCRRLALGTVLHASAGRQRSPLLHMKAAHAGGPLLAGQHRAQRVFAAFFLRRRTVLLQCDRGGSGGKGVRAR